MICLFNRKELLTTHSLEQQAKIRDILAANGIEYRVRARSNTGGFARTRTVIPGMKQELMYQYYIYVKRSDYEKKRPYELFIGTLNCFTASVRRGW